MLDMEIELGNKVVETYYGWTVPETLFVLLERPFHKSYEFAQAGIEYSEPNDPDYWNAEYRDKGKRQVLACKF
ncbi:MAG: hypothetical protein V4649_08400 [Bacteroidota bacterium]